MKEIKRGQMYSFDVDKAKKTIKAILSKGQAKTDTAPQKTVSPDRMTKKEWADKDDKIHKVAILKSTIEGCARISVGGGAAGLVADVETAFPKLWKLFKESK